MPDLTLNEDEANLLNGALRSYLSEFHTEIANTDSHDMREELKRQESVLQQIADRLGPPPIPDSTFGGLGEGSTYGGLDDAAL
jgi:hypothetical protein